MKITLNNIFLRKLNNTMKKIIIFTPLNFLIQLGLINAICLICGSDSLSQPKLDSLLAALKTLSAEASAQAGATHDTTKINLLNSIAWQLKFSYPDSALTYARKALNVIASRSLMSTVTITSLIQTLNRATIIASPDQEE